MRASRSSVKFLRVSTKTKGTPRFLCHQSVILGGKSAPSAFAFPPPTPRVSLISTPMRPRLSASQRFPCAPRRCEAEKNGVGKRQFNQHFTVALRKHSVCAVLLLWEEDWWSPRPMAGSLAVPTLWREKPTWMRRQSGWRESEREGQGWLVTDYFCNVYQSRLLNLCFWWVAITRVANKKCLRLNFRRNYRGAGVSLFTTCIKYHAEAKLT